MAITFSFINQKGSDRVSMSLMFMSAVCVLLVTQVGCKPVCTSGWYFDKVTGNCDHCSDICHQAEKQGTTDKCETLCPDFTKTRESDQSKCPPLEYYDPAVDRCDPCSSICLHAEMMGTDHVTTCKKKCPDWPISTENVTVAGNASVLNPETSPGPFETYFAGDGYSTLQIVGLSLVCSLVACLVVIGIIWYMKSRNKDVDEQCNRRGQQPQQIESHELESLTGRGAPLTHPEEESDQG